jgi:acetyl-CoA synthetase
MVIANLRSPRAPRLASGSMGVPLPGFEVRLVSDDGTPVQEGSGRVAVKDNGFFLSGGYWQRQPEWEARFVDGWFLTEDVARCDGEGRYWFEGRSDDVIVTAGYNIGPVEVESALMAHPLIADAACVGEPDPVKGTIVVAYVVLDDEPPPDLRDEVRRWIGERIGWHAAPRRVEVMDELPHTDSGKLQRALLRRRALEHSARP